MNIYNLLHIQGSVVGTQTTRYTNAIKNKKNCQPIRGQYGNEYDGPGKVKISGLEDFIFNFII